jgi:hypothetical protein
MRAGHFEVLLGNRMEIWPETIFRNVRNDIRIAATADEILDIGKLRYSLYVDRDRKLYEHADHRQLTLIEPVDTKSLNFYAGNRSGLRAAVRVSRAAHALNDPLLAPLMTGVKAKNIGQTVVCSRFVVEPSLSARKTIVPLFQEIYRAGLRAGATKCLLSTRTGLVNIFGRFGFKETGTAFVDAVAGQLNVCELDMHDYEFLIAISSPLIDVANERFAASICSQRLAVSAG